jgi:flagellar protein FliO/FliZ
VTPGRPGRAARGVGAIALALAATILTPAAHAQADAPPATSSQPAEGATPLALRPAKPLVLAEEPPHAGWGWKLAAVIAVAGGAAFAMRKRGRSNGLEGGQLTIVRRAAIGIRSELLIVNVEGQRLLIGVTPHSIQSLAILDGEAAMPQPSPAEREEPASLPAGVGERFAAMLKSVDRAGGLPPAEARAPVEEEQVAGQARGLLSLRRRG